MGRHVVWIVGGGVQAGRVCDAVFSQRHIILSRTGANSASRAVCGEFHRCVLRAIIGDE